MKMQLPASQEALMSQREAVTGSSSSFKEPSGILDCPWQGSLPHSHADSVRFGMDVSPHAGCCVNKLKTGTMEGCCNKVSTEKHLENFRRAVEAERAKTGQMPKLDTHTQAILAGRVKPGEPFEPVSVSSVERTSAELKAQEAKEARLKEPLILRVLYAPFRFMKWLLIGFWKDMKQLVTGRKVD